MSIIGGDNGGGRGPFLPLLMFHERPMKDSINFFFFLMTRQTLRKQVWYNDLHYIIKWDFNKRLDNKEKKKKEQCYAMALRAVGSS